MCSAAHLHKSHPPIKPDGLGILFIDLDPSATALAEGIPYQLLSDALFPKGRVNKEHFDSHSLCSQKCNNTTIRRTRCCQMHPTKIQRHATAIKFQVGGS